MLFIKRLIDSVSCSLQQVDFLGPLALRLYLAPVFWSAGSHKIGWNWETMTADNFASTVAWFGNADWGLGLPLPALNAGMAAGTEVIGALCLLFGVGVRFISIPLMVTMVIAAWSVHIQNGWGMVADASWEIFSSDRIEAARLRLARGKEILQEHANYSWLTEEGNFTMLNNGIEMATTYFIMLLVLVFLGGGKYISIDHWVKKYYQ